MKKKIGILGGSFDPIHQGHLNIAQSAYEEYHLDEVWFIPAGHSPNKNEKKMTPAETRAEMVSLAIEDYSYFRLSRIELEAKDTSYTYLTLSKLKEQYPDDTFYFIMGADSLDYFEKWVHPEIICQKAIILTAVRDHMDISAIHQKINEITQLFPAEIYPIVSGRTNISSSELRENFAEKDAQNPLLPQKVEEYIHVHHLYDLK